MIPFLYCLEQGSGSCPDVAFEALRAFRGLPEAQLDAQILLQAVVEDVASSFEWLDYTPLAVKLITGLLDILLRSASPPSGRLHDWVMCAFFLAPEAKEVIPLMDLVVDFSPGVCRTSQGSESLAILRAIVYFRQAVTPGGPNLDATLGAAEFGLRSLSGQKDSVSGLLGASEFVQFSSNWLNWCYTEKGGVDGLEPYKDRLLYLITWQISNLPIPPAYQIRLRMIRTLLMGHARNWEYMNVSMPQPTVLDDNDKQLINESYLDLLRDGISGEDLPAKYPKGAAEMVKNFLTMVDSEPDPRIFLLAATIARALHFPEAFNAYELFMNSLEARQWGTRYLCLHQLKGVDGFSTVIRDAISLASETGNYALALQWSDQGRSKIWDWFFHSRLSIEQVQATEPIVAGKLKTRPRWLDASTSNQQDDIIPVGATDDFSWMVEGFMLLPGLDRFLRPITPVEIMAIAEALGGYIIYLNADRYSSHALAILPGFDNVVHIALPNLDYPRLLSTSAEFSKSPKTFLRQDTSTERIGHAVVKPKQHSLPPPQRHSRAKALLEQLWTAVVKPVLDGLGIDRSQTETAEMARIWWCPSGPLSGLPIHAAGIYTDDGQGPVISDYVVSSYFPSASALHYATRPENPSQKFSLLTIANPTGAGLPGTETELELIKGHTLTKQLIRDEATVEAVKMEMEDASWVHFACHGEANADQPMEGALILANRARLTLRDISNMSLPHAQFAFLSACSTAKGVSQAPDQFAHLSTGMLACGYRSIIGTMWQISDEHAPFVADRVYTKILEGGRPDYKRAAYALHDAIQALRKERKVGFETWVPFIHIGV
ncbi:hypothetical protein BDN72DRAFT_816289 [Pluteus cervinus]|uniref:Uncharacterized protein n=1 Tax=Pluteus cervinus TaxID=181527 RepID=A0ACD3B2Q5_9AGAR|nr:hypothetical protein BDN72DRAFT_816289 [Pluteus cervinus]